MIDDVIRRWQARLEEWRQFGCQVDGGALIEQFLADLEHTAFDEDGKENPPLHEGPLAGIPMETAAG